MALYKGDDTIAFGGNFLTINVVNSTGVGISKAVFKCGTIIKTFKDPQFPLTINLTSEETDKLSCKNTCYLAVYDIDGNKRTCEGSFTFQTKAEVVTNG